MAKRGLSRKELEEIKKREEIEAAAEVINNFQGFSISKESICYFIGFIIRYSKSLQPLFKKMQLKSVKFGLKRVPMMLVKEVFDYTLFEYIHLLMTLFNLQRKMLKIKANCINQHPNQQAWQNLFLQDLRQMKQRKLKNQRIKVYKKRRRKRAILRCLKKN